MSKNQVLEEIYPDEVPGLLKKANIERARQREKELTGYFYTLIAPVLPYMKEDEGLSKDIITGITDELHHIREYLKSGKLNGKEKEAAEPRQQSKEDPYKQLENLQNIIAGTRIKMSPGKAR